MKRKMMLILTLTCALLQSVYSQGVIAKEGTSGSSFYQTLEAAILSSQAGDVLYVPGGTYYLGTSRINKPITIIGVGHYPDSTTATNQTIIAGDLLIEEGAHNLHIEGLYITGNIGLFHNNQANNVIIQKCNVNSITSNGSHFSQFDNDTSFSFDWQINHNVIRGDINLGNFKNPSIKNNIVKGRMYYGFFGGLVENNVFLFNTVNVFMMEEIRYFTFKNNIFLQTWELSQQPFACYNGPCGSNDNVFMNNSFCFDGNTANLNAVIAPVQVGNIYNAIITECFINANDNPFSYTSNYHIHPNLNAMILGTDGLEIGIYGGNNPYKEGAVPFNPHIQSKNIAPSTNSNGMLNVNVKVNAQ